MFSIILVVVAIGLMAAVAAVSINYIPMDAQMRALIQKDATNGFESLEGAVTRYVVANRATDGTIPYPSDFMAAVTPQYGFRPADVRKQMTWELASGTVLNMPAIGICLRPINTSTPLQREVLGNIQAQLPVGSAYVGTGCNATANAAGGGALTYWVVPAHIN
jgi:hypothetical protein